MGGWPGWGVRSWGTLTNEHKGCPGTLGECSQPKNGGSAWGMGVRGKGEIHSAHKMKGQGGKGKGSSVRCRGNKKRGIGKGWSKKKTKLGGEKDNKVGKGQLGCQQRRKRKEGLPEKG